ncbi:MAG: hypothetical protein U1E78_09220 [Gammaproteobacteria bacterium]
MKDINVLQEMIDNKHYIEALNWVDEHIDDISDQVLDKDVFSKLIDDQYSKAPELLIKLMEKKLISLENVKPVRSQFFKRNDELAKVLFKQPGFKIKDDPDDPLLHYYITKDKTELAVELIKSNKVNINEKLDYDTALHLAIKKKNDTVLDALVSSMAINPSIKDINLMLTKKKDKFVLKLIKNKKINPNEQRSGRSLLALSILKDKKEITEALVAEYGVEAFMTKYKREKLESALNSLDVKADALDTHEALLVSTLLASSEKGGKPITVMSTNDFIIYCHVIRENSIPMTELFLVHDIHWVSGEIRILSDNQINVFFNDSLPSMLDQPGSPMNIMGKIFSDVPDVHFYYPDVKLQRAPEGCKIFALDGCYRLDHIKEFLPKSAQGDLFKYLADNKVHQESDSGIIFSSSKLPLYLMKTMQSRELIKNYETRSLEERSLPLNKKIQNSEEVIKNRFLSDGQNKTIDKKRGKLVARLQEKKRSVDQLSEILLENSISGFIKRHYKTNVSNKNKLGG